MEDWVKSEKLPDSGDLAISKKKFSTDDTHTSIFTPKAGSFYHYIYKLATPITNVGKDLVFQYALTHDTQSTCGGGYFKLLLDSDPKTFDQESKYAIMFGPDHCGSISRIHLIFNIADNNVLKTDDIPYTSDQKSHIYTLVVRPDDTYEVFVDCKSVSKGSIPEGWDYTESKMIPDPNDSKPAVI